MSSDTTDGPSRAPPDADPDYPLEDRDVCITYRQQGPFGTCPSCGGTTWRPYRCNAIVGHTRDGDPIACGRDLAASSSGGGPYPGGRS